MNNNYFSKKCLCLTSFLAIGLVKFSDNQMTVHGRNLIIFVGGRTKVFVANINCGFGNRYWNRYLTRNEKGALNRMRLCMYKDYISQQLLNFHFLFKILFPDTPILILNDMTILEICKICYSIDLSFATKSFQNSPLGSRNFCWKSNEIIKIPYGN